MRIHVAQLGHRATPAAGRDGEAARGRAGAPAHPHVLFTVAATPCAIEVRTTRHALRPSAARGEAVEFLGRRYPILDVGQLLGLRSGPMPDGAGLLLVVEGDRRSGALHVDAVTTLVGIDQANVSPLPAVYRGLERQWCAGVAAVEERLVVLVRTDEILDLGDRGTGRGRALGGQGSAPDRGGSASSGGPGPERDAVLVGVRGHRLAVPAERVLEVARCPEYLAVPCADPANLGVTRYRGQLIPLVDAGYGLGMGSGTREWPPWCVFVGTTAGVVGLPVDAVLGLLANLGAEPGPVDALDLDRLVAGHA